MSKTTRTFAALGAVLFVVLGLAACGGGVPGNAVVNIDSANSITKAAYEHWLGVAASANSSAGESTPVPDPPKYTACIAHLKAAEAKGGKIKESTLKGECETEYKSLQQEVLGFLISSSWVLGEARAMGVKASDTEVRNDFLHIKHEQFPKPAEFEKFLASSGQTVSDLLLRVKLNMLSQKIQQKIVKQKPTITKAEAEKYFKEHQSTYGTPEHRNVEIILTAKESQAAAAKKEIEGGKSFSSVASRVSIDPTTKKHGGYISELSKGEEEQTLDNALFTGKVGVLSGPLKTQFGYYVYEVLSTKPGSQKSFASVEKTIKQTLATQKQQKALSSFIKNFKKKWQAKTDCRTGYIVADCKQYKAPKTKTGKTSTGTTE